MRIFPKIKGVAFYGRRVNNGLPKRVNWEHIESIPRQEGRKVLKGTSKRVVVVKSPDPKFFEQAIFIMREDIIQKLGGGSPDVLREAQRVADEYVRSFAGEKNSILSKFPPLFFAAVGAVFGGIICLCFCLAI